MLPVLMAFGFAFVWACSYWCNRDLFSPTKLYLLTLCVCFLDIFLTPYRIEICCIYVGFLLVAVILVAYESTISLSFRRLIQDHKKKPGSRSVSARRIVVIIWLLTSIPVFSIAYLVMLFGGLRSYLDQLAVRALAFRGLNSFSEPAINLISLLTVLYFGVGLIEKRRTSWWICYSMHFTIAVTILSMSGSRRYFLMPLVMMLATSHYLKSEVSIKRACGVLALLLVATSVFG